MSIFQVSNTIKRSLAALSVASCLLLNPMPMQAQATPDAIIGDVDQSAAAKVFLPLVFGNDQPAQSGNGSQQIQDAGRLVSEGQPEFDNSVSAPRPLPPENPLDGPIKAIQCSIQDWQASKVHDLQDRMMLDGNAGIIYPGALVQGKNLEDGYFTPITIPRSGGRIRVEGLKLAPAAQYAATVPDVSGATVKQAVEDILSVNVQGTAARAGYEVNQTYSYEHMLFTLGIDARYGLASMKANLKVGSTEKKNYVFLKFAQTFYDVIFEDPELSTSVFRVGENFQDPENQIYPGNPPLYVQKVSYGRMVFFVAESDYSNEDVEAAFRGAYSGVLASVKVKSGLTYQEIMQRTKVYYYVIGGDAGLALAPIDSATPAEMYDKVKSFLADKEAANFSPSNPGVPIAYTLRYLHNRDVARMSYSVTYGRQDCHVILRAAAKVTVTFSKVHIINDSDPDCFICGDDAGDDIKFNFKVYGNGVDPVTDSSDPRDMYSGKDYPIELSLSAEVNEGDKLRIYVDGTEHDGGPSPEDQMGNASAEWGFDTEWGSILNLTHSMYGKHSGDGAYNMFYHISVEWLRSEPANEYNLVAKHSGKCLEVLGVSMENGIETGQWDCLGSQQTNQLWRLQQHGNNYSLIAVHSGKCLDLAADGAGNNAGKVHQWDCTGGTSQLWKLQPLDATYQIIAPSGKCLDVSGVSMENGAVVWQWDCIGQQTNQLWSLRRTQ